MSSSEWVTLSNGEDYQLVATYEGVEYWLPNDETLFIRCIKRKMPNDEDIEQDTNFYEMDDFRYEDSDYRQVEHNGKLVCKFEAFKIGDRVRVTRPDTKWGKDGGRLVGVEYDNDLEYRPDVANPRIVSGDFSRYIIEVDDEIPDNLKQIFPTNRLCFFKHDNPVKIG